MAVDNIFGDKEAQETPAPSKDKSKKHAAPASKVSCFTCASPDPSITYCEHSMEQSNTKNKHAETVSIPYDTIPGMDTNSMYFTLTHRFHVDSTWTPYGKDHNLQFCMESKWTPDGLQVDSSTCIITKKYQYFSLLHLFLLDSRIPTEVLLDLLGVQ